MSPQGASISALKLVVAGAHLEATFAGNTPLGLSVHKYPEVAVLLMLKGASTLPSCCFIAKPATSSNSNAAAANPFGYNPFGRGQLPQQQELKSIGTESIFSLAIRQVDFFQAQAKAKQNQPNPYGHHFSYGQQQPLLDASALDSAAAYFGAAITALDCGFALPRALDDTICAAQFPMLLNLLPKVSRDDLHGCSFPSHPGQNMLHRLANCTRPAEAEGHEQVAVIADRLLQQGLPMAVDAAGMSPLHVAAKSRNIELLLHLLKSPASPWMLQQLDHAGMSVLAHLIQGSADTEESEQPLQEIMKVLPLLCLCLCPLTVVITGGSEPHPRSRCQHHCSAPEQGERLPAEPLHQALEHASEGSSQAV